MLPHQQCDKMTACCKHTWYLLLLCGCVDAQPPSAPSGAPHHSLLAMQAAVCSGVRSNTCATTPKGCLNLTLHSGAPLPTPPLPTDIYMCKHIHTHCMPTCLRSTCRCSVVLSAVSCSSARALRVNSRTRLELPSTTASSARSSSIVSARALACRSVCTQQQELAMGIRMGWVEDVVCVCVIRGGDGGA